MNYRRAKLRLSNEITLHDTKKKGGACQNRLTPPLTFQLFIYENLSVRYHYPIKRTRDVKKRIISLFSLLITNENRLCKPHLTILS